jgi:hypothetical protein
LLLSRAATQVGSCVVVSAPHGPVVVGQPAQMVVARCDAHGNRVMHAKDAVEFTASAAGPGTSIVKTFDQLDGSCVITVRPRSNWELGFQLSGELLARGQLVSKHT